MQAIKKVVVVVNGQFAREERLLAILDSADCVIAADGGANWLAMHQRTPDRIVGDMDSVDPALLARLAESGCHVVRFPAHKDETDAELALAAAAALAPAEIVILGALGGRIDHTLGNLSLLSMPVLHGIAVSVFDGQSASGWPLAYSGPCAGDIGPDSGGDARDIYTRGWPIRCGRDAALGPSRISNVLVSVPAYRWAPGNRDRAHTARVPGGYAVTSPSRINPSGIHALRANTTHGTPTLSEPRSTPAKGAGLRIAQPRAGERTDGVPHGNCACALASSAARDGHRCVRGDVVARATEPVIWQQGAEHLPARMRVSVW